MLIFDINFAENFPNLMMAALRSGNRLHKFCINLPSYCETRSFSTCLTVPSTKRLATTHLQLHSYCKFFPTTKGEVEFNFVTGLQV